MSAATKAKQEQAAKERRMAKLYSNLDAAVENLNRLIESGKFFDPVPKKQSRKRSPTVKLPVFIKKVGAITITSDEPLDYHRYGSFKDKIKTEGLLTQGQIRFTYTNSQGEITIRTVNLIAVYPAESPEYLVGYCELRKEERTFRLVSIQNPIDTQHESPISDMERWLSDRNR
ncbi:WYL domain-containing protein [Acidovorax sp. MR-S7]|uniref:WYL domain-containing protein n=2 Tax=Comamonadaceae TaxID=80864 RepID=UPI00133129EB|nr:WYL domain-containing protein [Acidovorax sp. MR-S7]